jgi:hypothetical protein
LCQPPADELRELRFEAVEILFVRLDDNEATGISDIEGKAARVAASELGNE